MDADEAITAHPPTPRPPAIGIETTWFDARWAEWSRGQGLPDVRQRPLAPVTFTLAELRRQALEFFSWGCVHQAITQQRLEELLPTAPPPAPGKFAHRLPGLPADVFGDENSARRSA